MGLVSLSGPTVGYSLPVDITHSTAAATPPPPTEIPGADVSLDTGDSQFNARRRGAPATPVDGAALRIQADSNT